jgi:putative ABC transport system permease protein
MEPPSTAALIVRAPADPAALAPLLRDEVRALDADLPVYRVLPMEDAMAEASWNSRVSAVAITTISLIALCLSLVGLYAVTAHAVAQRTPELGVRIAFGASHVRIGWLVLRRAYWQLALGLAAGVLATVAWARLFGAAWFSALNLAGVMGTVVLVATIACLVPARRAMRLDPVAALRNGA